MILIIPLIEATKDTLTITQSVIQSNKANVVGWNVAGICKKLYIPKCV